MLLDHRYQRPSDNPLRIAVYAVAATLAVYAVLVAVAWAGPWNGRTDPNNGDRVSTSAGTGGWFRDAQTAFEPHGGSGGTAGCGCTNSAGRMSGPV